MGAKWMCWKVAVGIEVDFFSLFFFSLLPEIGELVESRGALYYLIWHLYLFFKAVLSNFPQVTYKERAKSTISHCVDLGKIISFFAASFSSHPHPPSRNPISSPICMVNLLNQPVCASCFL